jgi:O-acetyl-ADP-ribose deacetylase (regulator of RNase III)
MDLRAVRGDITEADVDVIVNAANPGLLGGGGVDGAIHRAAGPSLLEECRAIGRCMTGDAKLTGAGDLPARHVIHAVGPRWRGGGLGEPELLEAVYRRTITLADSSHCPVVALPSISTGAYGFPVDRAAPIAIATIREEMLRHPGVRKVRFWLFDEQTYDAFREALENVG